ncbi:aminotransferase class I/II-fold pyridoxal phosphate-dependent enzyme [Lutimonas saemankumensis]|uniref:pyridoxal phosphate-dependent aminotransferase n=1 Tax=Lutimonas saemankumensis TaxID=483016 RepID=UPI001CD73F51|nr:aminotransferase class I/II-fold pyridoxal phosphate-dependent enzyme [Lutimonas saemankumensis]MCA0932891.1 aminotransferase class I/II-fold pyridoxal phosphate-dependent enzyme [Lutimonas saemankumensis]
MIPVANRLNDVKEYYFSIKLKEVRSLIEQGKPIINLGIGSPDLSPPESVTRALYEADIHGYQSYQGLPELRKAMSDFYRKYYDVDLKFDAEVLPLMGSKEGIMHISMAFLNKGDHVLIPDPGYPTYASVSKLIETVPVKYKLAEKNNWWPDLEALEELDLSKVKIMWVNYPHMPTGSNGNKDLFEALIEFGKKHSILIVNDNPYSFILNDDPRSILSVKGAKDVAIELNSLSKTFNMAGWRVGMVVGQKTFLDSILKVKSNMDSGMYFGIQKGAIAALNISRDWFSEMNEVYKKRRQVIWEICDLLGCTYDKDSSGLFVWARIPENRTSEELTDQILYKHDVFVTPGTVFGEQGQGYIRFSLCLSEDKIREVLSRLTKFEKL